MELNERQSKILKYLKKHNDFVSGSDLANHLDVSDRTIRSDIQIIKSQLGEESILSQKSKGYLFNLSDQEQNNFSELDFSDPNSRILYLLKELLLNPKGFDLFDLAEELFVSERTLDADSTRLKKILLALNLDTIYITRTKDNYSLENFNTISNNLLYDVACYIDFNVESSDFQKFFQNINIDYLKDLVVNTLKNTYNSKYLSIHRLIMDFTLIIASHSTYSGSYSSSFSNLINKNKKLLESCDIQLSTELCHSIGESFGKSFSETDINFIATILYIHRRMDLIENDIRNSSLLNDDFYQFCYKILLRMKDEYDIDFLSDTKLMDDFIFHIRVAISRIELGIKLYNPLTDKLLTEYAYVVDLAVMIADELFEKYQVKFDFNEISYIGIYIATAMNSAYSSVRISTKIKILLYVPEGISVLNLLHRQIISLCDPSYCTIDGVTNLDILQDESSFKQNYNLLITTSKCIETTDSVFKISRSLNQSEKISLKNKLSSEIQQLIESQVHRLNNQFLDSDLFVSNIQLNDQLEAINFLTDKLIEKNNVGSEFKDGVLDRERIFSTAFDTGVAFPHSMKNVAKKTSLAILLLNQPILWGKHKVKFIFMYANSKISSYESRLFSMLLINAISDNQFIDELKKCKSYENFYELFTTYCIHHYAQIITEMG